MCVNLESIQSPQRNDDFQQQKNPKEKSDVIPLGQQAGKPSLYGIQI